MRLFVAADVPADLKQAIESSVVGPLLDVVPGARWSRPEGRHLTLKFLGRVDEHRIPAIAGALRTAVATREAFDARFEEVGAFPSLRRPRVLWVGIGTGGPELVELAGAIDDALRPLGFAPEDRPFHPHLTLARFKAPGTIRPLPPVAVPSASFRVDEAVLFRSQLHPKGARYSPLESFPLAGGGTG